MSEVAKGPSVSVLTDKAEEWIKGRSGEDGDEFIRANAKLDELSKGRQERKKNDMRQALKSPEVRRVLFDLLDEAKPYSSSFSRDPYVTAFKEGRRDIGLAILGLILDADPTAYIQMQREANSNSKTDDQRLAKVKEEIDG